MSSPAPPPIGSSGRSWSDLGPRVISAIVIIVVIATALYFGGFVFAGLAAVVFGLIYREWEQMITLQPLALFGFLLIAVLALAAVLFPVLGVLGVIALVAVGALVSTFGDRAVMPWRIGGLAYFGAVIIAVLAMRGTGSAGITCGWFLGLVIGCNDTGAYFSGRYFGGPKLAPQISPGKTISGAVGGWVIGTFVGTVFWMVFTHSPWWIGLILAALLGLVGQAGDLAESYIKRIFRIKDSSDFIPGHGGFMDRLDSVTAGALFVLVVGGLHGGLGNVAAGFLFW